jgi:enoyl-CoA hydratase/carnithine racemase
LITLNKPSRLNCLSTLENWALDALFQWFDNEPALRCAVITGSGRAFCAGADLKEWDQTNDRKAKGGEGLRHMPPSGFGGVSRRMGRKPLIGAINGLAYGGGMEMVANMDLVFASQSTKFSLSEVKRGVAAVAGSLPRIIRTIGRPRAMDMALTGRAVSAQEAEKWGFVNEVTDDASIEAAVTDRPVVKKALEYAVAICSNSPDAVIVSRAGVAAGWEDGSADHATTSTLDVWQRRLLDGENMREGVKAFVEKRAPRWVPSKL